MLYSRIVIENNNLNNILEKLKLKKKSEFGFYDLIYTNNQGKSITDDTLKIRVYSKNEWNTKNVLVIRKTAILSGNIKEDKVLLKKEFDNVESAKKYVEDNLSSEFTYSFKLSKTGKEYSNDNFRIWIEDIENFGLSVEIEAADQNTIEEVIKNFNVIERLEKSIPEILYERFKNIEG